MKRFALPLAAFAVALGATPAAAPALAGELTPSHIELVPSGNQKVWHATLDLRDLPPETRPATITAVIGPVAQDAAAVPRITVAINGLVVGRAWAKRGRSTTIEAKIEERFLSVRNHIAIATTALGQECSGDSCSVAQTALRGPVVYSLAPATAEPVQFAQYVPLFRKGVAVKVSDPRHRAWGELAAQALAPHAPRRAAGPAEIVVSRATPRGTSPRLRFDTGPVSLRDDKGRLLYDQGTLDRYTIVQMTRRGNAPVLWVRPGAAPAEPPARLDLDNGNIAFFGLDGREIAFAPEQDRAVTVAYAADARREAQTALYWRLAIAAVWLALTVGLVTILRRMAPIEAKAA